MREQGQSDGELRLAEDFRMSVEDCVGPIRKRQSHWVFGRVRTKKTVVPLVTGSIRPADILIGPTP